eukprot:CAMPEP_0197042438 /NCGR_PEP_ID=MMETSP1384-20130603/18816_1 /TAXON_ID=29189 /ORGANISM="Ammonia sp." /LENGTH=88 /DNA_ID=CAMNT_0042473541 /DNA_START=15 /DNA_END=278 /DNA_ORIENTATION=-
MNPEDILASMFEDDLKLQRTASSTSSSSSKSKQKPPAAQAMTPDQILNSMMFDMQMDSTSPAPKPPPQSIARPHSKPQPLAYPVQPAP